MPPDMTRLEHRIFPIAISTAALFWIADAVLDYLFFYNASFSDLLLFKLPPLELYTRLVLTLVVLTAALTIRRLSLKQQSTEMSLRQKITRLDETLQQELMLRAGCEEERLKFSYVIEQSPSIVIITDTAGDIEYVNPKFTQITRYTLGDVQGKNPRILKSGKMMQTEYQQLWDTITAGNEWRGVFCNRKKTGELYWETASISPIKNKQGKITHYLAVKEDITEQVNTQQALRQSEERFRQVVVSISDHIYVTEVTPNGQHLNHYLSPHIEALTGYPHQNFIDDWSFWPEYVIHPDDRPIARLQMSKLMTGANHQVEYRLVRKDGAVIWVRDSARVQRQADSRMIYGVVSDITQRKQVEEQIRTLNDELEQRVKDRTRELSALYEVTAVGSRSLNLETMLALSLERSLTAINSEEGYIYLLDSSGEKLTLAAQQAFAANPRHEPAVYKLAGWILEHSEPLLIPDIEAHFQVNSTVHCAYAGAPIRASDQTIGVLSIVRGANNPFSLEETALLASIADQVGVMVDNARLRRQAEHAAVMEERERLARELHDSVTQSLYSLTLLTGGGLRMARAGTLTDVETYFTDLGEIARQALKEMRLLVHELRPTVLEQAGLVGALQQRLDAVEGRSGIEARLLVETPLDVSAHIEEGLYRIALEALNNSIKHAAADQIVVKIFDDNQELVLEVTDNGVGFDQATLNDTGGMGLISVQERAAQLGGQATITSTPGQGTSLQVRITVPGVQSSDR